jgi:hypothetical protein
MEGRKGEKNGGKERRTKKGWSQENATGKRQAWVVVVVVVVMSEAAKMMMANEGMMMSDVRYILDILVSNGKK